MDIIRNKILIISDEPEQVLEFRQKLSGLKSTNLIYSAKIENALNTCTKFIPDVVIAFTDRARLALFVKFCRETKSNNILKNTSIIFILEELNENFILSSYDASLADYIVRPVNDVDILTRVLWAFQKKELLHEVEKKENILKYAGIFDEKTEVYTTSYVEFALTSAIETAKKYQYPIVLMAIVLDPQFENDENDEYLATIIRNSTRKSDIVGSINDKSFFLLLNRTNLDGAHIVYNKLADKLGELSISVGMSIGICESFSGMSYQELSVRALNALNEAIKRGGNRIMVFNPKTEEEEMAENLENNPLQLENDPFESEGQVAHDSKGWLNKITSSKKKYEFFSQEFTKKVNFIISPLFLKLNNYLSGNYVSSLIIDQFTTDSKCYFSIKDINSGDEGLLQIMDLGTSKVVIDITFIHLGKQINKRSSIEIHNLTQENFETILMNFFNEFEKITDFTKVIG